MQKIRPDSLTAGFYNDGLVLFFYDDQSQESIRAISPSILEGYGNSDINSELFEVTKKGLLVVYGLQQDDEITIELSVGEPLSNAEEKAFGTCLPVQRAYLNLPSGKLAIESYNNLRLSLDFDPDEEPGALFTIPAGEYVLSIYSLDVLAEDNEYIDDEFDESRCNHLFVLTPLYQAKPLLERKPLIDTF
ncbi:hypothetical protein [Acaryochloris sp. CCMEE 5410]|uniref:hypothetical protein n=1 Tax=Acaryochloris sp. CCMEE 5410 TaxID=310037 RepID=UPI0002484397|nr:hypothetical protein [Acaryochloris sp. CCMEE 5410]KAI9129278.1 hypothetical protein ON05_034595 [Acaryochloris sp. CCMEE 5410]